MLKRHLNVRTCPRMAQVRPLGWWAPPGFRQVPVDSSPPILLSYIVWSGLQGDLTKPWRRPPAERVYLGHSGRALQTVAGFCCCLSFKLGCVELGLHLWQCTCSVKDAFVCASERTRCCRRVSRRALAVASEPEPCGRACTRAQGRASRAGCCSTRPCSRLGRNEWDSTQTRTCRPRGRGSFG